MLAFHPSILHTQLNVASFLPAHGLRTLRKHLSHISQLFLLQIGELERC